MARQKLKSGAGKTLTSNVIKAVDQRELILTDFRISKMVAERFATPEESRSGTYRIEAKAEQASFPDLEVSRDGTVSYTLNLIGKKQKSEDESDSSLSFSISINAEGKFEIYGDLDTEDGEQCASVLEPIILLMHGLCVHHARAEADSLGYRSIHPSYQPRNRQRPVLEAVEEKK